MTHKIALYRKWTGPIPIGRDGKPIPQNLWPRRRKHVWVVRWFAPDAGGMIKRPSRSFPTREEAESFRTKKASEFSDRPTARKIARKVTLGEFVEEFCRLRVGPRGQKLSPASLRDSRTALTFFANYVGKDKALADVTRKDVLFFIASLREARCVSEGVKKQRSPATVNKIRRTLHAAFNVAVTSHGYLVENPFDGLKADRVTDRPIRYVSPTEFVALMNAAAKLTQMDARWWRAFLAVCYTAGLRYGETLNLTWGDVDFSEDVIQVTAKDDGPNTLAWRPKDYESRNVPIPTETTSLLVKLHEVSTDGNPYLFLPASRLALVKAAVSTGSWRAGQAILNNVPRKFRALVVKAAAEAATLMDTGGEPTITIHDLRRSAVTNWSKVANMQTVMLMAGHSNIETTRRYYAAATDDQVARVREASADPIRKALESGRSDPKVTPEGNLRPNSSGRKINKSLCNNKLRP